MYEGMLPPVRNPIQSLVKELQLKSVDGRFVSPCTSRKAGRSPSKWYYRGAWVSETMRWGAYAYLVRGIVFAHGSEVLAERVFVYCGRTHIDDPKG